MTVYCVAQASRIDPQGLAKYREHAPQALKKHGGQLVMTSNKLTALEGATDQNDMIVILSFPSLEAAKGWREDKDLAHVHELRNRAGDWTIQVLDKV